MESNNIRTGGGTEIPDYLATNPPLESLYLANNNLDDNDAVLVARALKSNKNFIWGKMTSRMLGVLHYATQYMILQV